MLPIKRNLPIPFAQGLDTKTDPFQVRPGKFLAFINAVFTQAGLLKKRNGFQVLPIPTLPVSTLTTFKNALIALTYNGYAQLYAFITGSHSWSDQGFFQAAALSTQTLARTANSQVTIDTAVSNVHGLVCSVWIDSTGQQKYQVNDKQSGQIVFAPGSLPATAANPRVFLLGNFFVITFMATVGGSPHLQYFAIPLANPLAPRAVTDLSTNVVSVSGAYDGFAFGNNLFLVWAGGDMGGAIRMTSLSSNLTQAGTVAVSGYTPTYFSVVCDSTTVWITFYQGTTLSTMAYSYAFAQVLAPTSLISISNLKGLTSVVLGQTMTAFYQLQNVYSYSSARTDLIYTWAVTQAGAVGSPILIKRGVGLASKAFYLGEIPTPLGLSTSGAAYPMVLLAYGSANSGLLQPTYFLSDVFGNVVAKLAYENGAGYFTGIVLPSVTVYGQLAQIGYLYKDLIQPANPQSLTPPATSANLYSQVGLNLVQFDFTPTSIQNAEIADGLHVAGGFLWLYDGILPAEHGFHVFPEDIVITTSGSGGFLTAQDYWYSVTYEWTDGQGLIHRSAPSLPVKQTTTGSTSTNTINVPTLRLTGKISGQVRIVIYRWSTAQQTYYQVTSLSSPIANDTTTDSVAFSDTLADSSIIGNNILYTTGGIVENIPPPALSIMTTWKGRLWVQSAENKSLFSFSKGVIQSTPVEMSDLFTYFVNPNIGPQGPIGDVVAAFPMDDKLIFFRRDGMVYLTGDGPDLTGANNDYGDPVFITSTVGCVNANSIVMTPRGLLFDTDKGRWLLGRDLTTTYLGAPVEAYNGYPVTSALAIPGTNQVRLTLASNITLMYDYFYDQWGTFQLPQVQSSAIYQGLQTILTSSGLIMQEVSGSYLDASNPVLMAFTTNWYSLASLQGYQRAYFFDLLGMYLSPHKIQLGIAYDYNSSPTQTTIITPDNYLAPWGGELNWGAGQAWGGAGSLEQWRVNLQRQRCQSFQIQFQEIFDASYGVAPGAGLTLSGINLVYGTKKGYFPLPAAKQAA